MSVFKIIYNAFLVFIILIALLLVISIFPITGNYKVLVVKSGSMEPAIKTGSLVVSRPAETYAVGDIITFRYGETSITHRIQEKNLVNGGLNYVTKGDANKGSDRNEILPNEIIGRVCLTVPYLGYAIDTAKKPWGFILIVILPALIIVYDEIKKIFQEVKRLRLEKLNKNLDEKKEKLKKN
ncbi:MAG TPA: signal peptidase I [bacterium]|nr:signal peptidase I [bacterium]